MISIVFLLKKIHLLVLVYNAEITVIDRDLYGEHRPDTRITGSKTDLDLSGRLTYTRVYMVVNWFIDISCLITSLFIDV